MNKKFSTLAVAAMLASAFTAYAGPGDVVTKLAEGNNGKQYQLRATVNGTDMGYLVLEGHDGLLKLAQTTDPAYDLGSSLWCVTATLENQGKNPIFDFTNKAQEAVLDITAGGYSSWGKDGNAWVNADEAHVGGEVAGWEFTPMMGSDKTPMFGISGESDSQFGTNDKLVSTAKNSVYSLNSYITSNRVATLIYDGGMIKVAVIDADKISELDSKQVKFFLQEAYPVDLTAKQFNTILNTQKETESVKMTFVKDYNNTEVVNPFSTNELNAIDAEIDADDPNCTSTTSTTCKLAGKHNFVYLYKTEADATKNYLRVDTAYANGFGTKFLTFAFESKFGVNKNSTDPVDENIIPNQYKFRLNYCPTDDSLSIQVMSALYKQKENGIPWSDETKWNDASEYRTTSWTDNADKNHPSDLADHQTNWVKLQDLELSTESRIITVGEAPINTHISFGYGDCAEVASEYTSVADGVYFIKNAKGQYLAHPIYNNGEVAPLFVTVNADEQNVEHMPAYQWVVLKDYNETSGTKKFSPVTLTNREFADTYAGIQLRQADGAKYMYVSGNNINGTYIVSTDSLEFVAVSAASVKDPYLGYKKLTKEELAVNKYTFNYWHPYADDKFIAQSAKDSTLTVLEGGDAFRIDTVSVNSVYNYKYQTVDIPYGYDPAKAKWSNGNERIPGLAQLIRTVYVMSKDGKAWRINAENKFNVSEYVNDQQNVMVNSTLPSTLNPTIPAFFLKENNQIGEKCYHALVAADLQIVGPDEYSYELSDKDATLKAGVSDYDAAATLKKQLLNETRTSAFYIAPDETPLYRRFNSTLEGQAGDAVDTLRFYEKYRNEYLMIEANKNFMVEHIDFLGIDAQDKAQGGLAFIVDTAWVNRGFGNIKPQYLISIDRHDYQGVAGEPCTEAGPHIDESGHITDDPYECVHAHKAVPGFKRGKFLINFHRFANNDVMVNEDDYKWAEYDRAGFKEAIVYNDTLYVLRDEFKNLKNEEIDLAKIASAEVEAQRAYSKKNGNLDGFLSYKYELAGDQHKYATWSMRFVDREKAKNEVEEDRAFLIESMNAFYNEVESQWIAPTYAAWLKMQNGCLVLSDEFTSAFDEVVTGGDDALIFNVEHVCGDKVAVDNENIAVEGVSVVAGNGQVTIMGAAGKNVTITNILGKVIASQVIASDNATIAVPAGIVAVAVEGEAAVKAIVK